MTFAEVQASLSATYNNVVNSEFISQTVSWGSRQVQWIKTTTSAYYPKFVEAMQNLQQSAPPQVNQLLSFVQTHSVAFAVGATAIALTILLARYFNSTPKEPPLGFSSQVQGERSP